MADNTRRGHEEDILAAFDRMKEQYEHAADADSAAPEGVSADGASAFEPSASGFEPPAEAGTYGPYEPGEVGYDPAADGYDVPDFEDRGGVSDDTVVIRREDVQKESPVSDDTLMVASSLIAMPMAGDAGTEPAEDMAENRQKAAGRGAAAQAAKKESKKAKKPKKKKRHIFLKLLAFLFAVAIIGAGYVGYRVYKIIEATPEINPTNIYDLLSENSVILDKDGNNLQSVFSGDSLRTNVSFADLPEDLRDAFISIEDKTFYEHHGFNYVRMVGAIWQYIKGDSDRIGGTSTITQQLARNLYLAEIKSERSITRKIQEAWYTIVIERALTKDQILEAYMNTIYLGFNCNGVEAASEAYFSKSVKDLNLIECATLAALPQSPDKNALIKRLPSSSIEDPDQYDIIERDDTWTLVYNNGAEQRRDLVLWYMHDQGKITDEEYSAALAGSVREFIKPGGNAMTEASTSYFSDYVIDKVMADLQNKLGYTREQASKMVYSGGLVINSTLDQSIQDIVEDVYSVDSNFADVNMNTLLRDRAGNILYDRGNLTVARASGIYAEPADIMVYSKASYFDADGNFRLAPGEFEWTSDGSLKVFKGKRLNIYKTTVQGATDYSVEFKGLYEIEDKKFYYYSGGYWSIPASYKDRDAEGNLILSAQYFLDKPEAFVRNNDGSLTLDKTYFTVNERIIEPQSAMVIIQHGNGHIVSMIGGRGIEGRRLFNRATSPRQPGSSIKPLAVYSSALQAGVDGLGNFTVAMPIDDIPIAQGGKLWPKNWYVGYRGFQNMRYAVEQSTNTCAVNLFLQLDTNMVVQNLQNMGITSIVTTGASNDLNAAALALGGMTRGISPLEMAGAYSTFGNYGTYIEPVCYTTVTNRRGDVILSADPITHKVYDEAVASLMLDILRTTVTNGLSSNAKLSSQPSVGKTGTTSDSYDLWFCGLTPQYTGAVWMGNDMNVELRQASSISASVWAKVMEKVGAMDERGSFEMRGEFVTMTVDRRSGKLATETTNLDGRNNLITEKFIKGTEPSEADDSHKIKEVCSYSGYLATPMCAEYGLSTFKVTTTRPCGSSLEKYVVENLRSRGGGFLLNPASVADSAYDTPDYYCPYHNPDTNAYPVSPYFMSVHAEDLANYTMPDKPVEQDGEGGEQGSSGPQGTSGAPQGTSGNPTVVVLNDGGGDDEYDIPPEGSLIPENRPAT